MVRGGLFVEGLLFLAEEKDHHHCLTPRLTGQIKAFGRNEDQRACGVVGGNCSGRKTWDNGIGKKMKAGAVSL